MVEKSHCCCYNSNNSSTGFRLASLFPIFADVIAFVVVGIVVVGVSFDVIRHFFDDDFLTVVKDFENFTCFLLMQLLMLLVVVDVDGLWQLFTSVS